MNLEEMKILNRVFLNSGKILRNVQIRLCEHSKGLLNMKTDCNYSNHMLTENFEILHSIKKKMKADFCETLSIDKHLYIGNLHNEQPELSHHCLTF